MQPDTFEQDYLTDRSPAELVTLIRQVRREIRHLATYMDAPHSEASTLSLIRAQGYLAQAITAYEQTGRSYTGSSAERRVTAFNERLTVLTKVSFSIGGYFGGYDGVTADLVTGEVRPHKIGPWSDSIPNEQLRTFSSSNLIAQLQSLNIGAWRHSYDEPTILDGTQWLLKLTFDQGPAVTIEGSNSYPPGFRRLELVLLTLGLVPSGQFAVLAQFLPRMMLPENHQEKCQFGAALMTLIQDHFPEAANYREVLGKNGLEWAKDSLMEAVPESLDVVGTLGVLLAILKFDDLAQGVWREFVQSGQIAALVWRLVRLDNDVNSIRPN